MNLSKSLAFALASVLGAIVPLSAQAQLFSDDFDGGTSAANWNTYLSAADGQFNFAYDYSTYTPGNPEWNTSPIPSAPRSTGGSTIGLRMAINDTAAARQSMSAFPKLQSFSGNYRLRFDMWVNYPGTVGGTGTGVAGSTETAAFGINLPSEQAVGATGASGHSAPANSVWFAVNGEGGSSATSTTLRDYNSFLGGTLQFGDAGGFAATGTSREDHSNAYYQTLFPASLSYQTPGAPGKQWVTVDLEQIGNTTTWSMNGTLIATRTGTSITSGNFFLGYFDHFNGSSTPAADSFVIYDNIEVVPEPASMAALALGVGGLLLKRRRRA